MTANPVKKTRARSTVDKEIRRRKILDAALELFNQQNYQGTSIEMITEKAGVSTGTFYLYFKGKLEIYRILNAEGNDILLQFIEEALSWPGMTPAAKMSVIAGAYFRYYTEYPGHFKISSVHNIGQKDFQRKTGMQEHLNRQADQILSLIEAVIKDGIETGEFAPVDTRQVTIALWGMLDGMFILAEREHRNLVDGSFNDLFKQGLNIVLHGLIKRRS